MIKYRVAFCKDFPNGTNIYLLANSFSEAVQIVISNPAYRSTHYPDAPTQNRVEIERYNWESQKWNHYLSP